MVLVVLGISPELPLWLAKTFDTEICESEGEDDLRSESTDRGVLQPFRVRSHDPPFRVSTPH
jgi:hypothetical protein